jgi:hypothetical protein
MLNQSVFCLLLLCTLSLYSCTKEKIPQVECINPTSDAVKARLLIVGNWEWVYERYKDRFTQAVIIKTPQTEGKTRRYNFRKNGNVVIYQNDSIVRNELYEVTTLNVVTGADMDSERTILLFKNQQTAQRTDFVPLQICNDTLTLNYQTYSHTKGQEKWHKN